MQMRQGVESVGSLESIFCSLNQSALYEIIAECKSEFTTDQ